jgi:outer membrane protein assembly factor BamB
MVGKTSVAELAGIRFITEEKPPETTEPAEPWAAALAVAHRRQTATTDAQGTACVRVDGAVYALDVATGNLLWRKYVGFDAAAPPLLNGQDVYVVDATNHDLLCLEARTGRLRWRQEFGGPFAEPLVVGARMYVPTESGRLYIVDTRNGIRMGYLQFAQPLRVTPAADSSGERLYLTGDHSSIYSISLDDLTCLGVHYLGHATGSIRVPPVRVLNKLAVLENNGLETCRLHLLSLDDQQAVSESVTDRRLSGLAATAPLAVGRRLTVITDRGQIEVFDVGRGEDDGSLTPVASRSATSQQPLVRHVMLADGHFWIGDTQLTKYGVQPTGNRLPVQSIDDTFAGATFDHPFQLFGSTLVHVRRPADRAGVAVAAMATDSGRTLWETDLAVPPAWAPMVDESARAMTVANANGYVFRLGPEQIRSGVQDEALPVRDAPAKPPALTSGVALGGGRAAFTASADSDQVLLYDTSQQRAPLRWVTFPSRLACDVSPFGKGVLAPLQIGQVFYVDPASGQPLATAFQPRLQPRTTVKYRPAAAVGSDGRQFVITDGREKIYLVALVDRPQPHLTAVTEALVGAFPIVSPLVIVDETVCGVTDGNQLARFRLPSLEAAGETDLREQVIWGPYRMGRQVLLITADDRMLAVSLDGNVAWDVPLEAASASDLAGPPLVTDDAIYLVYRQGILERRLPADGQSSGQLSVGHPLATGPVRFQQRVVLSAHDGTLLVVDQP